jgi:hypothetical protein
MKKLGLIVIGSLIIGIIVGIFGFTQNLNITTWNVVPQSGNNYTIGTSNMPYKVVYANSIVVNGNSLPKIVCGTITVPMSSGLAIVMPQDWNKDISKVTVTRIQKDRVVNTSNYTIIKQYYGFYFYVSNMLQDEDFDWIVVNP